MIQHLPALVFLIPFVTAVCIPLIGSRNPRRCRPIALVARLGMVGAAAANLWTILQHGEMRYSFGGWAPPGGIEWIADEAACLTALALSALSFLCLLYGGPIGNRTLGARTVPYYTIVLLLVASLTGVIYARDVFNVFVFLEVAALSGYALVGIPGGRALVSAFRYLIMGALGASFYLLGVGYFYAATGTLNMADLAQHMPSLLTSKAVIGGLSFMFIGLGIKMALMPLHGWLPDAYTDAPDAVSPLLAALLTKVALLAWVRILFWVLGAGGGDRPVEVLTLVWGFGAVAAVGSSFMALTQRDLKRMFAYGGLAHIGLALVAVGQGSKAGLAGGLFYLINDAVMQCALFMLAGAFSFYHGVRTLDDLEQKSIRSPWLLGALIIAAVSMIGLPPTGGFFGKWYIVLSAIEARNYVAVGAVIITTLLTLAYFIRIFERIFRPAPQSPPLTTPQAQQHLSLRVSLGGVSAAMVGLGLASDGVVRMLSHMADNLGI